MFREGHVPVIGVDTADREVERVRGRGGPVYDSIDDVPDARARLAPPDLC